MTTKLSRLDRKALGVLKRIGRGGQGDVYLTPGVRLTYIGETVYKEYHPPIRASLNVTALEDMTSYLETLSFSRGSEFIDSCAWPVRIVSDRGIITGFIMPKIPKDFFLPLSMPSGTVLNKMAEFQHLINKDSWLSNRGIKLSNIERYELLHDVARALNLLHRHEIVVGDLSPKNLLFSLTPKRRVYLIDCDSMRFKDSAALEQVETPGWEVAKVSNEKLATVYTDQYKYCLLVLRLFSRDHQTRNVGDLPASFPAKLRRLVKEGLSELPKSRPTLTEWMSALEYAVGEEKARVRNKRPIVQRKGPMPRRKTRSASPSVGSQSGSVGPISRNTGNRFAGKAIAALVSGTVVLVIFLASLGGGEASRGNANSEVPPPVKGASGAASAGSTYSIEPQCREGCSSQHVLAYLPKHRSGLRCELNIGIQINTLGKVIDTTILESGGPWRSQCEEAVTRWAYSTTWTPAYSDGRKVTSWISQPVNIEIAPVQDWGGSRRPAGNSITDEKVPLPPSSNTSSTTRPARQDSRGKGSSAVTSETDSQIPLPPSPQ